MAKKMNYEAMFTKRKDGRWQKVVNGKCLIDRDPEQLMQKILETDNPAPITFSEIADKWETEHRLEVTDRTWLNYKPHYKDILSRHGSKPIEDITALDVIHDLQRAKSRGLSATVVSTRRSLYSMILDFAVREEAIPYNPANGVKLPKGLKRGKRSAPDDETINKIFQNIDAPFGLFPFLLICTGLRKSEALALQWRDIDLSRKVISVTKSIDYLIGSKPALKSPKTESGVREVPIIDVLFIHLSSRQRKPDDFVFPSPESSRGGSGGGLMTERGYEGAWLRYCQTSGLVDENGKPVVTAHHLRHGMATLLFESGVDVLTAQNILGHANPEITQSIYTDLRHKQQQKSVSKLNRQMSLKVSKALKVL